MTEGDKREAAAKKLQFIKDESEYIRDSLNRICNEVDILANILRIRGWDD